MSQCVPGWDLDHDYPNFPPHSTSLSPAPHLPTLGNEVGELTWENGHLNLCMHGHGLGQLPSSRVPNSNIWDDHKPGDTLEAIVHQSSSPNYHHQLNHHKSLLITSSTTPPPLTPHVMDALVPSTNNTSSGLATRVESCSGATDKVRPARLIVPEYWSSCPADSVTESANTRQLTSHKGGRFTSTSPENTSSVKQGTGDDYDDSVCHSRSQREINNNMVQEEGKKKMKGKLSVLTKRTRAAAVHNQSERKRRDKINQKMKTLQKLVPNSSKTDKASMLDEVIEYLKQLQSQVSMMSRMNMSHMMLPYAMQQQQQLQMSMMAPPMMGLGMGMGMGMGMGHVMDINTGMTCRPAPIIHPAAFMPPINSWDGASIDQRLHSPHVSLMHDPMSTFMAACQSQPMTMDAYSRMAALYQQLHQNSGSGVKN